MPYVLVARQSVRRGRRKQPNPAHFYDWVVEQSARARVGTRKLVRHHDPRKVPLANRDEPATWTLA